MNYHELLDLTTVSVGAIALRDAKFFAKSLESPPVTDVAARADPAFEGFEPDGVREITVETPVGEFRTWYLPWRWYGHDVPTLLWHHGSGEDPFDVGRFSSNSFRRLFETTGWDRPVNLIAVRAPFHDGSSIEYARSMGELASFVGMLASSTALVEALTNELADGASPVVVSGISLGGWVANLHRAVHGSADRYVPIFAGAALGEMFASSIYRKMTGEKARSRPERLRDVLDFERAFVDSSTTDCSPMLGRYDRFIEFDVQRPVYQDHPLSVIDKGHVTGSLATATLRRHVRDGIDAALRANTDR